jgi:hypothetical protein
VGVSALFLWSRCSEFSRMRALGSSVNRGGPPSSSSRSNLFGKLASEKAKGSFRKRFER